MPALGDVLIQFQFYDSTIKRGLKDKNGVEIYEFQFYDSTIKSLRNLATITLHHNFNSTIVRLKVQADFEKRVKECYFNSTIVRLKALRILATIVLHHNFNSTIVRLKVARGLHQMNSYLFQFYDSTIKR